MLADLVPASEAVFRCFIQSDHLHPPGPQPGSFQPTRDEQSVTPSWGQKHLRRSMSDQKAPKTIELDLLNEVVTIELDELEEDATNLILVLNESECKVWVWTKLAQEYWQRGYHDEAEKIALAAITSE